MSTNSTSPETLFGGSWTKIQGRFLWATVNTPMVIGGSKTTDAHVLTVDEIPAHKHTLYANADYREYGGSGYWGLDNIEGWAYGGERDATNGCGTRDIGGGQGHSHTYMPPYFEVYMWYRTA